MYKRQDKYNAAVDMAVNRTLVDIEDHYIHGQPKHTASINATLIDSDPKVLASMEWFVGEVCNAVGLMLASCTPWCSTSCTGVASANLCRCVWLTRLTVPTDIWDTNRPAGARRE